LHILPGKKKTHTKIRIIAQKVLRKGPSFNNKRLLFEMILKKPEELALLQALGF
jgi:hypothetical protein